MLEPNQLREKVKEIDSIRRQRTKRSRDLIEVRIGTPSEGKAKFQHTVYDPITDQIAIEESPNESPKTSTFESKPPLHT